MFQNKNKIAKCKIRSRENKTATKNLTEENKNKNSTKFSSYIHFAQ